MSFTDLMSSGRGPGVIGALFALVVLLGFGFLFSLASDPGEDRSLESVVRDQTKEILTKRGFVATGEASLKLAPSRIAEAIELTRLNLEGEIQKKLALTLQSEIAASKAEIEERKTAFEAYKDGYRAFVRGKAKGEIIPVLETLTGVIYKNANIREVTAIGIQVRHDDGQKRIPFEELPAEMRDYYQFDPAQKEKAAANEARVRDQHEAAVVASDELIDRELAKQKAANAIAAKEKNRLGIIAKQAQVNNLKSEISDLEQQIKVAASSAKVAKAAGKIHFSKGNNYAGDIRARQGLIANLEAEIRQMQAK
jgi:hypothetical protein